MFNFIIKNSLTRKFEIFLTAMVIIVSCTVGLLAVNVSSQVSEGIVELSGGYDLVIGPAGSQSQLAFNSMFFTDSPLGTVEHSYYEALLKDSRVNQAIPFAQGDSYAGFKLVGTFPTFIENAELDTKMKGELFCKEYEAVIGYNVAKRVGLEIGEEFFSSHGTTGHGAEHTSHPYRVVGILDKTNTNYDNIIFVEISSVWLAHGHDEEHSDEVDDTHNDYVDGDETTNVEGHTEHTEEHDDGEHTHGDLTAILIKSKNPGYQNQLLNEYNKISGLQAITPTAVLRDALDSINLSKQIVMALSYIIFVMSIVLLFVITTLRAESLKNDVKLLRLIGIKNRRILAIFSIQTAISSFISLAISFGCSKVALMFINNISTGYGLVISPLKTYGFEWGILAVMFIVTLIPILLHLVKFFSKDITEI